MRERSCGKRLRNARWHFGNTRALYKMYFTSSMRDPKETAEQSACVRFAREFLPEVNKALSEVYSETPGGNGRVRASCGDRCCGAEG